MKRLTALMLVFVLSLAMFAGCAKTEDTTAATTTAGTTGETTTEKAEENIRTDIVLGEMSDIISLNPHLTTETTSVRVFQMIYNTLIKFNEKGEIVPALAESFEQPSDTEYVFHLREGVKFHNGETMTAKDVKFSLDRAMVEPVVKVSMVNVAEVNVIDDYTVQIKTSVPHAPFLMNLTQSACSILNEKAVLEAEANGGKYGDQPVGTGPMKLRSWRVNDNLVVERFDDYFGGACAASSITLRVIPESSSRTIALETGEVDFLSLVPAIDVERVKENPNLTYVDAPNAGLSFLSFNQGIAPLDNVKVRQALSYAINRQDMVDVILEGHGQIATSILTSVSPVYNTDLEALPYDIEKAKQLLVEAGYPDGFTIEIAASGDERNRVAQLLQSEYSKIGVTATIQLLEWGAFMEYVMSMKHQIFINGTQSTMNPDTNLSGLFQSDSANNVFNFKSDRVDQLLVDARTELDAAKRQEMYWEIQQILIDQAVLSPLTQKINTIAMNKGTQGVVLYPTDQHDFTNMVIVE